VPDDRLVSSTMKGLKEKQPWRQRTPYEATVEGLR